MEIKHNLPLGRAGARSTTSRVHCFSNPCVFCFCFVILWVLPPAAHLWKRKEVGKGQVSGIAEHTISNGQIHNWDDAKIGAMERNLPSRLYLKELIIQRT